MNTTWTANITRLDSQDFSKTYHPGSAAQYQEAAYVFNQIVTPGLSDEDRIALQDATRRGLARLTLYGRRGFGKSAAAPNRYESAFVLAPVPSMPRFLSD